MLPQFVGNQDEEVSLAFQLDFAGHLIQVLQVLKPVDCGAENTLTIIFQCWADIVEKRVAFLFVILKNRKQQDEEISISLQCIEHSCSL